jgi:hypothetical protein
VRAISLILRAKEEKNGENPKFEKREKKGKTQNPKLDLLLLFFELILQQKVRL